MDSATVIAPHRRRPRLRRIIRAETCGRSASASCGAARRSAPCSALMMRCAELLQLLVDLVPVVPELLEDLAQRLGEGRLQVGVVVELDVEVMADGVLDLGGLGLGAAAACRRPSRSPHRESRSARTLTSMPLRLEVRVRDGRAASAECPSC